ncbi:MAG: NUDIX domain-containing protein [Gammaproteobacteria bacterium]|nr:NUDIX domain-containing protein [Gammaproteobacteria bacterium]
MRAPNETFSYPYPHPAVTTDVVVFTIRDGRLSILLVERANPPFAGNWALPGGFLDIGEDLDACAARELEEETGISGLYLEQLYTFGATHRDPRERVISVTYYALVPLDALATPRAASDAAAVGWHAFDALPPLAFDHAEIVQMAHRRLVAKLDYSTIAFGFMPKTFTLSELQGVYEILLHQALDKRNFRKRMLSLDLVEETGKLRRNGKHRPAREYRVKHPERVEIIK